MSDAEMKDEPSENVQDVWSHNMLEELSKIEELVQKQGYTYISFVSKLTFFLTLAFLGHWIRRIRNQRALKQVRAGSLECKLTESNLVGLDTGKTW